MLLYEVNLEIDAGIEVEYRTWLAAHVQEILDLPGFIGAEIFQSIELPRMDRPDGDPLRLCVHYRLRSEGDLETYLRDHAPRLRAAGEQRFAGRFRATRRILASC